MRASGRCALARWRWKGKQYVVQVRTAEDGLVLQQLLYADEVRSLKALDIERAEVSEPELKLALQLIEHIAQDAYDPSQFKDEERSRMLAAIDEKIAGKQVVASAAAADAAPQGAQVIDLMEALRASLGKGAAAGAAPVAAAQAADAVPKERKGVKRAAKAEAEAEAEAAAPVRARARK
jgi:DNA end-binding protein Ku